MKIVSPEPNGVAFSTLEPGAVFTMPNGTVWLKLAPATARKPMAVDLNNGTTFCFGADNIAFHKPNATLNLGNPEQNTTGRRDE